MHEHFSVLDRPADLGFTLHGGGDKPCFPGDPGIFVKHVIPGSVMDGKLRTGDRLLSVRYKLQLIRFILYVITVKINDSV